MDVEVRNATAAADAAAWSQKKRARDDAVMFTLQDPTSTFVVPEPTVPELQMDTSYVQDMQEATPPEPVALPVTLAAIQAPNNRVRSPKGGAELVPLAARHAVLPQRQ
jgi:hypothetical protein